MSSELAEIICGMGVGAVGMVIMFFCYRQDRKGAESRLTKLLEEDQASRRHNTKALTELVTLMTRLNGHET